MTTGSAAEESFRSPGIRGTLHATESRAVVDRLLFLAGLALFGGGLAHWIHPGAGLTAAGAAVLVDAWLPSPPPVRRR